MKRSKVANKLKMTKSQQLSKIQPGVNKMNKLHILITKKDKRPFLYPKKPVAINNWVELDTSWKKINVAKTPNPNEPSILTITIANGQIRSVNLALNHSPNTYLKGAPTNAPTERKNIFIVYRPAYLVLFADNLSVVGTNHLTLFYTSDPNRFTNDRALACN